MFYTIKIMFLYQISILLPVGRILQYIAWSIDKCHNTIEELWMCSQTLTQNSSQVSPSMCPLPPFLGYLKRPTHVTKWLQTACSSHTNELFIHFFMHILSIHFSMLYISSQGVPQRSGNKEGWASARSKFPIPFLPSTSLKHSQQVVPWVELLFSETFVR
jgi:hypothetical protein